MIGAWSFAQWEINNLGQLPTNTGKIKYIIVVVDYFFKWTEEKALPSNTEFQMIKFLKANLIFAIRGISNPHK